MNVNLEKYAGKKVCVATSGGRDSMALLHYLIVNAEKYGIELSALNCDHGIRGEASARDSAFVAEFCKKHGVPLSRYVADKKFESEGDARLWRFFKCYLNEAISCDCVATAHHLGDNAETVLFNLARGTALKGMQGITDEDFSALAGKPFALIRPLIACTRDEIESYIAENGIPYVDDESNFTDDYTRNKIRHNVLPALEAAVSGAARAIYRFSRIAAEDEEYLSRKAEELISRRTAGYFIANCGEKVIFRRAAADIISSPARFQRKDYTGEHLNRLFDLQSAENGKQFRFLGLTAFKEEGGIGIYDDALLHYETEGMPYTLFCEGAYAYGDKIAAICPDGELGERLEYLQENYVKIAENSKYLQNKNKENFTLPELKVLTYDHGKIPEGAVVRFMKSGDKFTKFGGGTKNLGDYFTDKKVPRAVRASTPLICDGNDVLLIFGLEISDKVRVDGGTQTRACAIGENIAKI